MNKPMKSNKKGFTLTEMIIVVFILSSLMAFILPNVVNTKSDVDKKTCEAYVKLVNSQVQHYALKNGNVYPESLDVLVEGKYIDSLTCPDQRELIYDQTTHEITVGDIKPVTSGDEQPSTSE